MVSKVSGAVIEVIIPAVLKGPATSTNVVEDEPPLALDYLRNKPTVPLV